MFPLQDFTSPSTNSRVGLLSFSLTIVVTGNCPYLPAGGRNESKLPSVSLKRLAKRLVAPQLILQGSLRDHNDVIGKWLIVFLFFDGFTWVLKASHSPSHRNMYNLWRFKTHTIFQFKSFAVIVLVYSFICELKVRNLMLLCLIFNFQTQTV